MPTPRHFTESALFVNKGLYYLPEISSELKNLLLQALSSAKTNVAHVKYLAQDDDNGEMGHPNTHALSFP